MCEHCGDAVYLTAEEIVEIADDCVGGGIELLDNSDNAPEDWRERLNLHLLDIDNPTECVLGQVFKDRANNPRYVRRVHGVHNDYSVMYASGYDYAVYELFDGAFENSVTGPLGFSSYQGVNGIAMTAAWLRALC